jgi:hypothetical protein
MAWTELDNGALQGSGGAFDALITTDQNLRHQQNLGGRQLAILVLPTTSWLKIRAHQQQVVAVNVLRAGDLWT